MKNIKLPIILLLLAGILPLQGCKSKKKADQDVLSDKQQESAEVHPEVTFAIADDQPIYQYVESRGVVRPQKKVVFKPKISGFVKKSNLRTGYRVQEGDTLLVFQKEEWLYQLQQAKNKYQKALSKYRIQKKMRKQSNVNSSNGQAKTDKMIRITTGLAEADLALKRAKLNLSYTVITAPFSGRLAVDRRYSKGSFIPAGTKVGVLVNNSVVRVHFSVLEAELPKIEPGMKVDVFVPGGRVLHGQVIAVSPVVNTKSNTGEVIVRVPNGEGILQPGMTVEGRIQIKKQDGKARIPREAILTRAMGRKLIFKLHPKNNQVQWVYVKPVAVNKNWAIITNTKIAPGDTIAVDNHFALSHLQVVEPKMRFLQRNTGSSASRE